MSNNRIVAVVPAAGNGSRMKCEQPKQYMKIGELTILEHTLNTLISHSKISQVIVAISPTDSIFYTLPVASHPKVIAVQGGDSRAASVLAGLQKLQATDWAMVHDAARPCLSHQDMDKLIDTVFDKQQGGILAVPISDTVKLAYADKTKTIEHSLDRTYLWGAATPQLFKAEELRSCLQKALSEHAIITDEASAIEYCGGHPLLVHGRRDNIKITQPEDLAIATFYLTQQAKNKENV
ncbi:2-C-methyl-D-erythritol 4-phosphate cytidylyltransferase [Zophobihabitans entericus]|nr:2-C-methyl-D-erythritol 4-phosphate cytidylyltransferase [Zophobihabitans entericus]